MRRLLVLVSVLGVLGVACTTSIGGGGGASDGAGKPPCTAGTVLPSTPPPPKAPPTIVDDPATDLQLETPGYGFDFGDRVSTDGSIDVSADGSKVLVRTNSQNAVPGGFPGDTAWILRDRTTGQNTVVRSTWATRLPFGYSAALLPDGSVAFTEAGVSQPYPVNYTGPINVSQVFRWDVNTHAYTNLSLGFDGNPPNDGNPLSDTNIITRQGAGDIKVTTDGRYLFFTTDIPMGPGDAPASSATNPYGKVRDLFRRDLVTGDIVKIDVGNHPELGPVANAGGRDVSRNYSVSADGNEVAFAAPAAGGLAETGFCPDNELVFLRDIAAGTTTLVSHDITGVQRYGTVPHISADGQTVIYDAEGYYQWQSTYWGSPGFSNLAGVRTVVWNRSTDTTDWVLPTPTGTAATWGGFPSTSPDNNLVVFVTYDDGTYAEGVVPSDGDGREEMVLYDRATNTMRKLSHLAGGPHVASDVGWWAPVLLSPDGSRAYFPSRETLLPSDTNQVQYSPDVYSIALN
jgi:hypothetical protein